MPAGAARAAGQAAAAAWGATLGGGRAARLPLPREQRLAGGEGGCYVLTSLSSPRTSDVGRVVCVCVCVPIGSSMLERALSPGLAAHRISYAGPGSPLGPSGFPPSPPSKANWKPPAGYGEVGGWEEGTPPLLRHTNPEEKGREGRCGAVCRRAAPLSPPPGIKSPTAAGGGAGTARSRLSPAPPSALHPPQALNARLGDRRRLFPRPVIPGCKASV